MNCFNKFIMFAAGGLAMVSCAEESRFIGSWTAAVPQNITSEMQPEASTSTSLMSIDFLPGESKNEGSLLLSSIMDVTQSVQSESTGVIQPYQVSIAATASVSGSWHCVDDEDDELLLSFDLSTLNVNVDKNGVTFSQNILTGNQQPVVDSLTTATVSIWQTHLKNAIIAELGRYQRIEDVEVSKDGNILSFEIPGKDNRDEQKVVYRRVINS